MRIVTGSRLHFGLINAGNIPGEKRFGGLGTMIESPAISVAARPACEWIALGPNADRAVLAARAVAEFCGSEQPFEITVESCPPLHVGFGVGTQLALASGTAVGKELGADISIAELARIVGRGKRSAIGVNGFARGGFFVDHGRGSNDPANIERIAWPSEWGVLLVRPTVSPVWYGDAELAAFTRPRDLPHCERVAVELRGLSNEVATALREVDYCSFGENLYRFNRLAGEAFAEDQGGEYSSREVEEIVEWFRNRGIPGAGQSSWGPTVFAAVKWEEMHAVQSAVQSIFGTRVDVQTTRGANAGYSCRNEFPII